jgi:hypothetical protein
MKIQQKIEKNRVFYQQLKIEESVFTMGIGGGCIYIYIYAYYGAKRGGNLMWSPFATCRVGTNLILGSCRIRWVLRLWLVGLVVKTPTWPFWDHIYDRLGPF